MLREFPFKDDWFLNVEIFDAAIKKIESEFKIDRTHDIPYVAGYSKDGKTIFIDKDIPKSFKTKRGKVIKTDVFLILHEAIEKTLMDRFDAQYQLCHQIALRVEQDAVKANKIDWKEYNAFMNKYIKKIADLDEFSDVPSNLDLKCYEEEDDYSVLKRMVFRNVKGRKEKFSEFVNKSK